MKYQAPRFLFRRHEILRRIKPSGSFLEIGAGNLALSEELLQYFKRGTAVDFTDDLAVSYSQLAPDVQKRLSVLNIDFDDAELPETYDCIVACEVMEHIEHDVAFLSRVRDALNPGGQVIISVPARAKFWSIHDELVGHVRRYEKMDLLGKAGQAGFSDIVIVSYGYPWVNLLRLPRIWLARKNMMDRQGWSREEQTSMSNHRQIPAWLNAGLLAFVVNRFTVFPFALMSRLFNGADRSNGYVVTMRR